MYSSGREGQRQLCSAEGKHWQPQQGQHGCGSQAAGVGRGWRLGGGEEVGMACEGSSVKVGFGGSVCCYAFITCQQIECVHAGCTRAVDLGKSWALRWAMRRTEEVKEVGEASR